MFVHLFKLFTGSNIFLRFRSLDLYIYIYNFEISNSFQLIPQNLKKPNQLLTPPARMAMSQYLICCLPTAEPPWR